MGTRTVNIPPARTFGWLRMNGTAVETAEQAEETRLELAPGETRTVIWEGGGHLAAELGKDAELRLIQVSVGGSGTRISDARARCADGARFSWYRVLSGGGATYDNCSAELAGEGSAFTAEIGYRLAGQDVYDVNCEAIHTGRRTESHINASGVLFDHASKLLRGTIDLRKGCAGAVGSEMEDALLMDETVRNRSLPVILCAEEDVIGDHGATIGQPDEQAVYYLTSRGLTEREAEAMLARAKLEAVIRKIPDEGVRERLLGDPAVFGGEGGAEEHGLG